jgi:hypothetical protein
VRIDAKPGVEKGLIMFNIDLEEARKEGVYMENSTREMTLREYLSKTKDYRILEEMTRPRVEIWPDPWAIWVNSHREDKKGYFYCMAEGKASPLCPVGYH